MERKVVTSNHLSFALCVINYERILRAICRIAFVGKEEVQDLDF